MSSGGVVAIRKSQQGESELFKDILKLGVDRAAIEKPPPYDIAAKKFGLPSYDNIIKRTFELPPYEVTDQFGKGFEQPERLTEPPKDEWPALIIASYHGNVSHVEALLKSGKVDVNEVDTQGLTALMTASYHGYIEIVTLLIAYGAKVNMKKSSNGTSALMGACTAGHYNIVKLLLENGAKPNLQDQTKRTSLIIASLEGYYDIVELLLQYNSRPDKQDVYGISALMAASYGGYYEIVKLLLSKNSQPDIKDIEGMTSLAFASMNGHYNIVELLLKYKAQQYAENISALILACGRQRYDIAELLLKNGAQGIQLSRALLKACYAGHYPMVQLLLNYGAQIDFQEEGLTPLIIASMIGHYEVCKLLIKRGAKVDIICQRDPKAAALTFACACGHLNVVELLLENGAKMNINEQDFRGHTPLMVACGTNEDFNIVTLLLKNGAQVNICSNMDGIFGLIIACMRGNYQIVQSLLKNGAEVNRQDKHGMTALIMACYYDHFHIVKLLLNYGADCNLENKNGQSALIMSISNQSICELLCDNGAKVDEVDVNGFSALMVASINGYYATAQLLLERGIQVDMRNNGGETALMMASAQGHFDICQLLLERSTSTINTRDEDGKTALMLASRVDIVKLLIENGARMNLQDYTLGISALMVACVFHKYDSVALLLERGAEIDLQAYYKGLTALMLSCQQGSSYTLTKLLLSHGAKPNLKDKTGLSALHYAIRAGNIQVIKLLLHKGANPMLQNQVGENALIYASNTTIEIISVILKASNSNKADIFRALQNAVQCANTSVACYLFEKCLAILKQIFQLNVNPNLSGVLFLNTTRVQKWITPQETTVLAEGISISIPEDTLQWEDSTDLLVQPCFSGPFELPAGYESASPAYLIQPSRRGRMRKDVTIRMHHYAHLETEEDCQEMVFVSASTTPEHAPSGPVYRFRVVTGARSTFRPRDPVGEITHRHFCLMKIARRRMETEKPSQSVSARLYRNLSPSSLSDVSAVFCVCLNQPVYIKHADTKIRRYRAISSEEEAAGLSVINGNMISDEIVISVIPPSGWEVTFDKRPTKIYKTDLDLSKEFAKVPLCELTDYPPKFSIFVRPTSTSCSEDMILPKLLVTGLDKEGSFELIPPGKESPASSIRLSQPQNSDTSPLKAKAKVIDEPDDSLTTLNVRTALVGITKEWQDLGLVLGLKDSVLREIKANNPQDVKQCLYEVIDKWLKRRNEVQVSWTVLCEALRSELVGRSDIAAEIEKN